MEGVERGFYVQKDFMGTRCTLLLSKTLTSECVSNGNNPKRDSPLIYFRYFIMFRLVSSIFDISVFRTPFFAKLSSSMKRKTRPSFNLNTNFLIEFEQYKTRLDWTRFLTIPFTRFYLYCSRQTINQASYHLSLFLHL